MNKATHWDPFADKIEPQLEAVAKPKIRFKVPAGISNFIMPLLLLNVVFFLYSAYIGNDQFIFVAALVLGTLIWLMLLLDMNNKSDAHNKWVLAQIAAYNGWSFTTLKKPIRISRTNAKNHRTQSGMEIEGAGTGAIASKEPNPENVKKVAQQASDVQKHQQIIRRDPKVTAAYEQIDVLLSASIGQMMPTELMALYWGNIEKEIPFWMGLALSKVNLALAAKELKTDARGNTANHGHMLQFAIAYPLNRKTGIDAFLLAEWFGRDGWRDFKTESTEFNNAFSVTIRPTSNLKDDESEQALLRVLTPATQAVLIDLKRRYRAQFVIRNDKIFMSGYDLINLEEVEALTKTASEIANDFAKAAVSFKHYTE